MPEPRCIVIAGPNGAGKTMLAHRYLPAQGVMHFVNADLIATGLSPFRPRGAALAAGKLFLAELDRLEEAGESFAFETKLSGLGRLSRLKRLKESGYRTQIAFLKLDSPALAIRRIATRVRQGGHSVPSRDVERRFHRGWKNFVQLYSIAVNDWGVYDNAGSNPVEIDSSLLNAPLQPGARKRKKTEFSAGVGRALRLAAKDARKVAKMYGTPVYYMKDGKIVAERP
ncbi:MAG TPA: hypothetical protein VHY22_00620 [Chthoniobacteraceae bacterium]|jgi:predicted ABC-type ATPase|nr:hypothetical protein [Chthoniobacteraceae bacterium]